MAKIVTITIHEPYLAVLEKWASVSRTLNTATNACNDAGKQLSEADKETYWFCRDELERLTPALNHLHQQVRDQLWQTK